MELRIEYVPLECLAPYEHNAKQHPDSQIKQIEESIVEFGFNDPIAIWNGTIVEGHGRYIAAKNLGLNSVPVIRLDGLTDQQRRAYALIHNKLTMNTGFDFYALMEEFASFVQTDMQKYGFSPVASEKQLEDFFTEQQEEEDQRESVVLYTFTITPNEQRDDLLDFLAQEGIKYEEK